jgi:hypothetical protein
MTNAPGKGRPTPKRKEAEKQRFRRSLAPATTREAMKEQRAAAKRLRQIQREAWIRGDERALPMRDRGPAKRLARDIVDSRRNVAENLLPLVFVVLVLSVIQVPTVQITATLLLYVAMFAGIIDTVLLVRRVKREISKRYPAEPLKGIASYTSLRASQIRKLRIPRPQVDRGTKIS